jgi:hypothetical protein
MLEQVLNPVLYRKLERNFGQVKVASGGIPMSFVHHKELCADGEIRMRLSVVEAGEYYRVNCDRCGDTRHRLWINHRWGIRDPFGNLNLWLMVCYNEGCYSSYDATRTLYETMNGPASLSGVRIVRGRVNKEGLEARVMDPPGQIIPLGELDADHPACDYLVGRFFNPVELSRLYGVGYCRFSMYAMARNRIYIPMVFGGRLRGWQTRYIGDINFKSAEAPPKYFSAPGMDRRKMLYNLDQARNYRSGIMVEGPMSAWAIGPMTVASLGKSVALDQVRLLAAAFKGRTVAVVFDADVHEDEKAAAAYKETMSKINSLFGPGQVASVVLSHGTDPANFEQDYIRRYIYREAAKQGVAISFEENQLVTV